MDASAPTDFTFVLAALRRAVDEVTHQDKGR